MQISTKVHNNQFTLVGQVVSSNPFLWSRVKKRIFKLVQYKLKATEIQQSSICFNRNDNNHFYPVELLNR